MRILHFSDLHGVAMRLAESTIEAVQPDWIVLTGDMLPDFGRLPGEYRRLTAQREWWRTWRSSFLHEGIRTTFVRGNHEIEDFEDRSLRIVPVEMAGLAGFLEGIPARWVTWGYSREWNDDALKEEVDAMGEPLVVLSHAPPFGWLDLNSSGDHIGHPALREFLDPSEEALIRTLASRNWIPKPPSLVMCGHVHQSFGHERHGPTLVVNAATGFAVIDFDLDSGVARVRRMERLLVGRPDPYL